VVELHDDLHNRAALVVKIVVRGGGPAHARNYAAGCTTIFTTGPRWS
jgi:hypothetical protein